jgi:O-acetyl-ADP-ribose deacetylase (regulator of RNase III)
MRPRIFVGSSREAIDVCRAIQGELDDEFDVTVWDQDIFRLSYGALDSLLDALDASDAGVFVLRPDDLTESRGESSPTVRDNVIFELGMFIGRLGRDRTFMLTSARSAVRLPSDLIGLTAARYDAGRFVSEGRAAVAPACTKIRHALRSIQLRRTEEPRSQARLDRAMRRMSKDLETLLASHNAKSGHTVGLAEDHGVLSLLLGRASVRVEVGRIQDYQSSDPRTVIALPANEYFDDQCISDTGSSLGAFVQHHFGGRVDDDFVPQVRAELVGIPTQRVPRTERRIDDSYGIGQAVFLNELLPAYRLILVSATTDRTGIGLRAEPHFLYAAVEGVVEVLNEHRMNSLTMPVLGSGHGGMSFPVAVLFNLLAVRSILADDLGRHLTEIRIVVSEKRAGDLAGNTVRDMISQVIPV